MPFVFTPQVWRKPEFTLPVTVPAGAVAIEAPASPVGGAAAETEPARLNERRAAARPAAPPRLSRRARARPQTCSTVSRRPVRVRRACALSTLTPLHQPGASART